MKFTGTHLSRREVLRGGAAVAGTTALLSAARAAFPAGAFAQSSGPETTKATFGFIALTDANPLFVAKEKGMFAKYGVSRERSTLNQKI